MKFPISIACAYVALVVPSGFGQSLGLPSFVKTGPMPGQYLVSYTVALPTITRMILPGHPYSGEEIHQQMQTLPDGTRVEQPGPSAWTYRDSAGRTRTERRAPRSAAANPVDLPVVAEICDHVAGYAYYLDPVNRIAHRMVLPRESTRIQSPPQRMTYPASTTTGTDRTTTSEPLGTMMLEGIEVQGRRVTTAYAVGAIGNDRPIVATTEIWTSPDLGLAVLSKTSDPRIGDSINAVINISLGEPDAALFQVPPTYKVVDEQTVPFTFTISNAPAAK